MRGLKTGLKLTKITQFKILAKQASILFNFN